MIGIFLECTQIIPHFTEFQIEHIPRELNRRADALSNTGVSKYLKKDKFQTDLDLLWPKTLDLLTRDSEDQEENLGKRPPLTEYPVGQTRNAALKSSEVQAGHYAAKQSTEQLGHLSASAAQVDLPAAKIGSHPVSTKDKQTQTKITPSAEPKLTQDKQTQTGPDEHLEPSPNKQAPTSPGKQPKRKPTTAADGSAERKKRASNTKIKPEEPAQAAQGQEQTPSKRAAAGKKPKPEA